MKTPFLDGFRAGVRPPPEDDDLTSPEGQNSQTVPMTISTAEIQKLANSFACSPKTLTRLLKRGIDITSPSAVACALAGQRNISTEMAQAVLTHLQSIEL